MKQNLSYFLLDYSVYLHSSCTTELLLLLGETSSSSLLSFHEKINEPVSSIQKLLCNTWNIHSLLNRLLLVYIGL
jgi:hypothetical protein